MPESAQQFGGELAAFVKGANRIASLSPDERSLLASLLKALKELDDINADAVGQITRLFMEAIQPTAEPIPSPAPNDPILAELRAIRALLERWDAEGTPSERDEDALAAARDAVLQRWDEAKDAINRPEASPSELPEAAATADAALCVVCGQLEMHTQFVESAEPIRLCPIGRSACSGQALSSAEASALRSATRSAKGARPPASAAGNAS